MQWYTDMEKGEEGRSEERQSIWKVNFFFFLAYPDI